MGAEEIGDIMNLSVLINSIKEALNDTPVSVSPSAEIKKDFQKTLLSKFKNNLNYIEEEGIEYSLSSILDETCNTYNDKCDVFIETKKYIVIVEIDATRADQVAKKMLSRYYYAEKNKKPTVYICLLYPGTEKMDTNECLKYMNMGKDILLSMNSSNRFIGAFID